MHIVMISAESAPVASAGELGDFIQGLSHDLAARGQQVEIILPKYDCLRFDRIWEMRKIADIWAPYYDEWVHCDVDEGYSDGIVCYFIEPHSTQAFFQRGRIYGEPDDQQRFAFFSRAAMEFLHKTGRQPDVIHCHDWQTALVPALLYEIFQSLGMHHSRVCLTLHQLRQQGWSDAQVLRQVGLDASALMTPDRFQDNRQPADANPMKGGIVYANYVTTVSPRYAWEAQYTDEGRGLQKSLRLHAEKFGGILNGIDYAVWNPQSDPLIAQSYCPETLQRKARNKAALRQHLMLEQAFRPIVAVVGGLTQQTGWPLVRHAAHFCLANDAQFVLIGMPEDGKIENEFNQLKYELKDNPHAYLALSDDERLTHQVFAGADMVLLPSRREPCGLTALIGMRYGVVPVVRRVGGLADSVLDANYSDGDFHHRNGYVFNDYDEQDMVSALQRAIGLWFNFPEYFRQLRINGMSQDHSWNKPGQRYLDIYEHIKMKDSDKP